MYAHKKTLVFPEVSAGGIFIKLVIVIGYTCPNDLGL